MTFAPAEPRRWQAVRWLFAVGFVCALQFAVVFLLEDRQPVVPRPAHDAPGAYMSEGTPEEWLALADPTLFVLPHRQGFSGEGWLDIPTRTFRLADWVEPAQYLPLPVRQLGAGFKTFLAGAAFPAFQTIPLPRSELRMPEVDTALPVSPRSTLRIEGGLAGRRLHSWPELPAWQDADFLTNSVVQLLVDARGNPVSAVLLKSGVSSATNQEAADRDALARAKAARFEPVKTAPARGPSAGLTIGTMIFEWQTVLVPATNAPAEIP